MCVGFVIAAAVLCLSPQVGALWNDCPVIETVQDFDLDRYVEKTWYIQRQQVVVYQRAENLFCVTATYNREGVTQYWQEAVSVRNYANQGGVGGPSPSADFVLCATRPDEVNAPAKLVVSPCFLPPLLGGPYWVAALANDYSWAIVVAGQPSVKGQCGDEDPRCTTPEPGFIPNFTGNGEGLWFLTREQLPSNNVLDIMDATAALLGLCTARMVDVVHDGCTYEGSSHKN